jgi:homotetrameric cytidine deaminase
MKPTQQDQALVDAATAAREHAYAPYSRFRVGAAILLRDGRVVVGANVENASFGLTVCAERNAIAAAVSAGAEPGAVVAIAIAADADQPTPPCGACRQVLAEFGTPETTIILVNVRDGSLARHELGALLPNAFVKGSLPK